MKRKIKSDSGGLTIEVSEIAGREEQLLDALHACQEGRCDCPTNEYAKLESLAINGSSGKIRLRLNAKSGRAFDETEIEKCLNYTESKLDQNT